MPSQFHLIEKNLPPLLGDQSLNITEPELRETAYGVLLFVGRISGQVETGDQDHSSATEEPPPPPSPQPLPPAVAMTSSEVKKALGFKTVSSESGEGSGGGDGTGRSEKRAVSTGELVRVQMRILEQGDARVRHALRRIAPGQESRSVSVLADTWNQWLFYGS